MARCARPRPARWLASVRTQNFFNAARDSRRESTGCGRPVTTSRRRGTAFQPRGGARPTRHHAPTGVRREVAWQRRAAADGGGSSGSAQQRVPPPTPPDPDPDPTEQNPDACGICGLEEPPNPRRRSRRPRSAVLQWVQCDGSSCQRWFHLECLSVAPVDGDGDWFCPACLAAADSEDDEGNVLAPDVHA